MPNFRFQRFELNDDGSAMKIGTAKFFPVVETRPWALASRFRKLRTFKSPDRFASKLCRFLTTNLHEKTRR